MSGAGRILVIAGLILVALGLLLNAAPRLPLGWVGRLPGDIRVERGGLRLYVPLATSLVVSVALTWLLRLLSRR